MQPTEWRSAALGDLVELMSGATPARAVEANWKGGHVPWVSATDLTQFRLRDAEEHISESGLAGTRLAPRGAVLVLVRGMTLLRHVPVSRAMVPVAFNQDIKALIARDGAITAAFLAHAMVAARPRLRSLVDTASHGTGRLDTGLLRRLAISLPPIEEQEQIASALDTVDDKIELNIEMNETLEALARAIFEQRAMEPAAREGLPDGWTRATLGEHLDVTRGLSYTGAGLVKEGGMPLHNLDSVKEGGGYKRLGIKRYTGVYRERHVVRSGEVIVANTEQGHDELLIGCPAIVPRAFGETGLFSQDLSRIVPKSGSPLTPRFVYLLLASERIRQSVAAYANGTTVNHLPLEALHRPTFPLPPPRVIAEVDALVAPLLERIDANEDENATLTELRDTLLPGLVSGTIRLRE